MGRMGRYGWVVVRVEVVAWAAPGETFRPYVPCVGPSGQVGYTVERADGSTAVVIGPKRHETAPWIACSHPAMGAQGHWCVYAAGALLIDGEPASFSPATIDIGPLGPTMNARGQIAWRGAVDGVPGVYCDGDVVVTGSETFGLPAIDERGAVVYRDATSIKRWNSGETMTIAEIGDVFMDLGRFPCALPGGQAGFVAQRAAGDWVIVRGSEASPPPGGPWESLRGALFVGDELGVLYATPPGGALGLYAATGDLILAVGERFGGSAVTEFALNPVSIQAQGLVAVRIALDDGREAILRVEL